jgi:DNA-binding IclR family transcriptional regulator
MKNFQRFALPSPNMDKRRRTGMGLWFAWPIICDKIEMICKLTDIIMKITQNILKRDLMTDNEKGSLVAKRTLKALLLFADHKSLTLSEIARSLEISQTAAYRIVATLHEMGFIKRDENKRYQLDSLLIRLAKMVEPTIRSVALPVMTSLSKQLDNESVTLSVSREAQYVVIEQIDSSHTVKVTDITGLPNPLLRGALGKIHLAFKGADERDRILDMHEKQDHIDRKAYEEVLRQIRQDGYAFTKGEHTPDIAGISVPVFDSSRQKMVAGLSIVMPLSRFQEDRLEYYVQCLKTAADTISSQL